MKYTVPRGTKDILPTEIGDWQYVENIARSIFDLYHFEEIRTPIFESSSLFNRVIGEESDIVQKEMYTFTDKGGRDLSLRPEGTAPVARAYISNNIGRTGTHNKLYYMGPMFRYERPQAGRYRQFHQIGLESIGSEHPFSDAEVIALCYRLFTAIGLKNVKIYINSVGSETCRPVIEARLKQFLSSNLTKLSENLQKKYKNNPLKLLDSKDKDLQTYLSGLPDLRTALSQKSKDHFNMVLEYLDSLQIPFEYKPTLVRGLDYYTETVFEVVSDDLGAQNSICGGGRYNNLIKNIGGPSVPAVGFAFGLERIMLLLQQQNIDVPKSKELIYVAPLGNNHAMASIKIAESLRSLGINTVLEYGRFELNPHIKRANKLNATHMVLLGDQESESGTVQVKNMDKRTQDTVSVSDLKSYFSELKVSNHV